MKRFILSTSIALALGVGLALALLWVLDGPPLARAEPSNGTTRYVAPTGDDSGSLCTSPITPCRTIQQAVNVSVDLAGDEVLVAEGVYTSASQFVLYMYKTVAVRGGYSPDFSQRDLQAHPSIMDGRGQMRAVYISGSVSPTLDGFIITGGNASNVSNGRGRGGGIYSTGAHPIISNNVISNNVANSSTSDGYGGGIYLEGASASALISGNLILSNTASMEYGGSGGGVCLEDSDATLSDNTVQDNTACVAASGAGGGLYFFESDAMLSGNTVQGNTASTASDGEGGGLYLGCSDAMLSGNTVQGNTASAAGWGEGGGLYLVLSAATLNGNTIVSNTATLNPTATGRGGGLRVGFSSPFTMTNNLVADNHANTKGSGLYISGSNLSPTSGRLLHTTIAANHGSGQGVFVGNDTTLAFTNTIVAGHDGVGITVTTGSTVTLDATLWHNSGPDTGGEGTVISSTNVTGDPVFVDPDSGDCHIGNGSAAINAGVDAGVTTDIDGETRLGAPDLGADEFIANVYLPLVLRNY